MESMSYREVDQQILGALSPPGKLYWALVAFCFSGVLLGAYCWAHQIAFGLGVTGEKVPVVWGTYLVNFVFWVGIAHSGTLISAILFLFRAPWRTTIARSAEAMTVFAVALQSFPSSTWAACGSFTGSCLPNQRNLWPSQSPLLFDVIAVSTYLTVSSLFWYTGLIPDLAVVRDRATGLRRKIYGVLSLGWVGTHLQWNHYGMAYLLFAALATPLVISVHSVVSWDFALSTVPG
jgi:molybdopterin-containing oxidoreductase family membrane subunit